VIFPITAVIGLLIIWASSFRAQLNHFIAAAAFADGRLGIILPRPSGPGMAQVTLGATSASHNHQFADSRDIYPAGL
jgi:hypothetical protein